MKAWRARSSSGGGFTSSSPGLVAHVVSVVTSFAGGVTWTFDVAVASIADFAGMPVNGEGGIGVASGLGTTSVVILYPSAHGPGEEWLFDSVTAGLTFTPAATISDDSGMTS